MDIGFPCKKRLEKGFSIIAGAQYQKRFIINRPAPVKTPIFVKGSEIGIVRLFLQCNSA